MGWLRGRRWFRRRSASCPACEVVVVGQPICAECVGLVAQLRDAGCSASQWRKWGLTAEEARDT